MYRERPKAEPLQTWRDRMTLGKVLKWPMLAGAVALICRFAWRVYSGFALHGMLDILTLVPLAFVGVGGVAYGAAFISENWSRPISKRKRPF